MAVERATTDPLLPSWPKALTGAFTASAFALGIALLARPYIGIAHDAVVYIGQAMASLDPSGVGQDLMFRAEGQSGFTVFTPLATALVGALGPGRAAMAIGFAGLAAWVAASAMLCRRVAPKGVAPWLCLAWLLIGPGGYGGFGSLHFAESFANPRPFAEAGVLAALALFLADRRLLGGAFLVLAALVHPLIALAGLGTVWVVLAISDRRWLWLAPAGLLAVGAGAALGLPVVSRLAQPIDPEWLATIAFRNPYLLPGLWRMQDWAQLAAQGVMGIAALRVVEARVRPYLIGALATAAGGTFIALSTGLFPSLLILQLQTWRAAWLLAALSAAVTPIVTLGLWREGSRGKALLALLWLAQLAVSVPVVSFVSAAAALAMLELERRGRIGEPRSSLVVTLWGAVALVAAGGLIGTFYGLGRQAWTAAMVGVPFAELSRGGLLSAAALTLSAMRLVAETRLTRVPKAITSALVAATAVLLGLFGWDSRAPFAKATERAPLMRQADLGSRAGQVLWLPDQTFAPLITGRPAWLERAQGAGDVFSRPLAIEWRRRVLQVVQPGLASYSQYQPDLGRSPAPPSRPIPSGRLASVCGANGPAVIVVDRAALDRAPPAGASLWRSPVPIWSYSLKAGWSRRDAFVIVRCP
jgi:hypothetical protein